MAVTTPPFLVEDERLLSVVQFLEWEHGTRKVKFYNATSSKWKYA